jgi:hypothetical protein
MVERETQKESLSGAALKKKDRCPRDLEKFFGKQTY